MFNNVPKILAHQSSIENKNFITPEYILHKSNDNVDLFHRYCPHRMFPLGSTGNQVENIVCKFHGYEWNKNGIPINNDRNLSCGKASIGRSGLIFQNFNEPAHRWVSDLEKENKLIYSHTETGSSNGSWLWMMEIQADLLHIRRGSNVIHPDLSENINLLEITMENGKDWILQSYTTGWWLFIYPFTFIEWQKGCLSINYTIPCDIKNEFGFFWNTQFYYDSNTSLLQRKKFETLEDVFKEDVSAIELQKGSYFPLMFTKDRLEEHCVHFGKWVKENRVN